MPEPRRAAITVSVMMASILQTLDTTIANVALPHIRGSIAASSEQMSWVLTSYIVAAAITTPLCGWLAGRYGRKKVLVISVLGFTITSALCGMAQTVGQIVVFRLLQGASGSSLVPLSQAVLLDINPPERQGRAAAAWGMGVLMGPILGPVLGGWLTENYSWRWAFYLNVPFGVLSMIGIMSFLHEGTTRKSRFDFLGFASLTLAVGALQIMLDRGELLDWFASTEIWIEAIVAGGAFYVFLVHTFTARVTPFVSPAMFADRNFAAGALIMSVVAIVLLSTLALLPTLMQDLMGYPVAYAGVMTAPRGVGALLTTALIGRFVGRVDPRLFVGMGLSLTAVSLWQMSGFSPLMDERLIILSGSIQGVGTGLTWLSLAAVSFTTLAPAYRYEATAIFNLLRNIGGSIGIAITQALLTRNTQIMHARLTEHLSKYGTPAGGVLPVDVSAPHGLAVLDSMVTQQAAFIAYNANFRIMFFVTLAVIPLVMLLRGSGTAASTLRERGP